MADNICWSSSGDNPFPPGHSKDYYASYIYDSWYGRVGGST